MMLRRKFYFVVLVLALVIPATVVYASHTSVTLQNGSTDAHQVDLLDTEIDGPNATYTYAVTGLSGAQQALSHWVLAIESCIAEDFLVSPTDGSMYNTPSPSEIDECGPIYDDCQAASYTVTAGYDGSTGMSGLKFDVTGSEGLKDGETHIFQITVKDNLGDEDVNLLTKYGPNDTGGDETITGPVCSGATAVTMASNDVSSSATGALLPFVLLMGLGLSAASLIVWRKQAITS